MQTEIDQNECEHFLKANLDRIEFDPEVGLTWRNLRLKKPSTLVG